MITIKYDIYDNCLTFIILKILSKRFPTLSKVLTYKLIGLFNWSSEVSD